MSEQYPPLTDTTDDLPRTLRRERESRERAAREMQARNQPSSPASGLNWDRGGNAPATQPSIYGAPETNTYDSAYPAPARDNDPVTVDRFKVPFFSLMAFYIKSVFAAVPALIILMAMLYGIGVALQTYLPQLIKMKITISFP